MNKNMKMLFSVASVVTLAFVGLQGCGSDSDGSPTAGAAGKGVAGGAGKSAAEGGAAGAAQPAEGGAAGAVQPGEAGAPGEAGSDGAAAGAGGAAEGPTQADLCEKFCADEATTCSGDLKQYANSATCLSDCNGYTLGEAEDTSGNTLYCRIYHLNAAATMSAMMHCPHTSATPTAFCVVPK